MGDECTCSWAGYSGGSELFYIPFQAMVDMLIVRMVRWDLRMFGGVRTSRSLGNGESSLQGYEANADAISVQMLCSVA